MNESAELELKRILSKDPADLTEDEQGFVQARRSYLTSDEAARYPFLAEKPAKAKAKEAQE